MTSLCALLLLSVLGQSFADSDSCTSIAVGHAATIEGSGLVTHNNDCNNCDPRVAFIAARDHALGAKRPIMPFQANYPRFVNAYRSETYAPAEGQKVTEPIGYIDEVPHTYAYWEAGYPLLNEHGLGFGESTCAAFLIGQSKMDGGEAIMSLAELMQVALERCKTARCAIEIMGDLAVEHGFYGEDPGEGGAGESLAVADGDETWVFHITGGLRNTSATWVAQKVPSDHVAVVANNFIIRKLNCADADNFMCSHNVFSNAREMNLCDFDSDSDLDFMRCYTPDVRTFKQGHFAIPYYSTLRMWGVLNLANPNGVVPPLTDNAYEFPFSIPVAKKVSRADVMNWTRYHYQGTEYDMSQGVLAGPFNNPTRVEGGQGILQVPGLFTRGISIMRTNYALVVETKSGERAGQSIAWFSTDQPLTGVFAPFVATSTKSADAYHKGHLEVFSRDSAFWAFNFVSNWMNINYRDMKEFTVGPAQQTEQELIFEAIKKMEADWPEDIEAVNEVQHKLQTNLIDTWWALADTVIAQFSDGQFTQTNGSMRCLGYSASWLEMIGFNEDFTKPNWVQWSASPPNAVLKYLPVSLLQLYQPTSTFLAAVTQSPAHPILVAVFVSLLTGIAIGAVGAAVLMKGGTKVDDMTSPLLSQ